MNNEYAGSDTLIKELWNKKWIYRQQSYKYMSS